MNQIIVDVSLMLRGWFECFKPQLPHDIPPPGKTDLPAGDREACCDTKPAGQGVPKPTVIHFGLLLRSGLSACNKPLSRGVSRLAGQTLLGGRGEANHYSHRNFHSNARIVSVNSSSTVNARGRRPCFTAKSMTISRERRLASMPKRSGSRSGTPVAAKEVALASWNRR